MSQWPNPLTQWAMAQMPKSQNVQMFYPHAMGSREIAFIGTGVMGASMCGHLLNAGHRVTVFSRTREKAAPLVERGAVWAESPATAAKGADVIITMVGM